MSIISVNEAGAKEFLTVQGWPIGLQDSLIKSCKKCPLRFIIVDDSGSMMANDGHRLAVSGFQTK